ncbi:hypothetical protein EMIHUDRAFT_452034 [Emiliania huxleyi CCMP1516]|uniref:SET domain-containing protein n=2 Tax=Emiliania huxleyi TaxID=2903 RepID=A0A0D3IPE9_EMIH1|nr:hypothetical protein EMIHUDRAFT_452034 [Emiliania huxleyi CCMP1516]EOD13134.1 hypothetical protein EMIHUDRAFT_452034 [Emiliania huxleyi CCMP1516]|eukprot:XP_005765563.1 hypothetical protein EMIHUDRAFT_452034 [Emiliania huxleyi CCMP1516]
MLVYVVLQRDAAVAPNGTVHALLLPSADGEWEELSVGPSQFAGAGFGVFPRSTARLDWGALETPVLMPYLGLETVVQDAHLLKLLLRVLQGNFVPLTAGEVAAAGGGQLVADGLCAVCYLLSEEVQADPHLPAETVGGDCWLGLGDRQHQHADRNLATHVAHVWRKEEGYVLINAHPAFAEPVSLVGMINEPPAGEAPTTRMIQAYARLLDDADPLLAARGLRQPDGAREAWVAHTLPPQGAAPPPRGVPHSLSERMVLYCTTRKAYREGSEISVDYGVSYSRDYASSKHRATPALYKVPSDEMCPRDCARARWPQLPGWHNPDMQPRRRPLFRKDASCGGAILVCPDDPALVRRRKQALGIDDEAAAEPLGTPPKQRLPPAPPSIATVFAKRKRVA